MELSSFFRVMMKKGVWLSHESAAALNQFLIKIQLSLEAIIRIQDGDESMLRGFRSGTHQLFKGIAAALAYSELLIGGCLVVSRDEIFISGGSHHS